MTISNKRKNKYKSRNYFDSRSLVERMRVIEDCINMRHLKLQMEHLRQQALIQGQLTLSEYINDRIR